MKPVAKKFKRPLVGVGVFCFRNGKLLLGRRKGAHGGGEWALPGGHLEGGESFEECCKREVMEETGLRIDLLSRITFTNDIFQEEGLHYVTLFFLATITDGKLENREPKKCSGWKWFGLDKLPQPLFRPLGNILAYGRGIEWLSHMANQQDKLETGT